eukprot:9490345-Pyramimonas_sp.AAC.1
MAAPAPPLRHHSRAPCFLGRSAYGVRGRCRHCGAAPVFAHLSCRSAAAEPLTRIVSSPGAPLKTATGGSPRRNL